MKITATYSLFWGAGPIRNESFKSYYDYHEETTLFKLPLQERILDRS